MKLFIISSYVFWVWLIAVKALNQARLEANVRIYGEVAYQKKWPSPFAIVSGILLLLSFLKYVYQPFRWLALGAVAAGIFPIAWRGIVAIRNFTLDINILVLIAGIYYILYIYLYIYHS